MPTMGLPFASASRGAPACVPPPTRPPIGPSYNPLPGQAGPSQRRPDPAPSSSAAQDALPRAPSIPGSPRPAAGSTAPRQALPLAPAAAPIPPLPQELLDHIAHLSVNQNDIPASAAQLARLGAVDTTFRAAAQSAQNRHPEVVLAAAAGRQAYADKPIHAAAAAMEEIEKAKQKRADTPDAALLGIARLRLAAVIESMPDVVVDLRPIALLMRTEIVAVLREHPGLKTLSITLPSNAHDMKDVMDLLAERPGVLRSLGLHGTPGGTHCPDPDQLLRVLRAQPGLEALNLSHMPLPARPTLIRALAPLTRLHSLSLVGCDLRAAGAARLAEALSNHTRLRHLDLSQNPIGDAGAQALAPLLRGPAPLESLVLNSIQIGPAGGEALAAGLERPPGPPAEGSLRRLSLAYNNLGNATVPALARALQSHPALQELDLGMTRLYPAGMRRVIQALSHLPSLQALSLHNNVMNAPGFADLSVILLERPKLQKLNLRSTHMDANALRTLQPALQGLTGLKHLDLSSNSLDDAADGLGVALQAMPGLQTLELQNAGLTPPRMQQLANGLQHCTELRELNLQLNKLGGAGAHELATVLQQTPHLEKLNLGDCQLNPAAMAELIPPLQAAQNLQVLRVHGNNGLDEAELLAQLSRLRFRD